MKYLLYAISLICFVYGHPLQTETIFQQIYADISNLMSAITFTGAVISGYIETLIDKITLVNKPKKETVVQET